MTWTLSLLTDLNSNTPHSLQNISYCYISKSLVFNPMIGASNFFSLLSLFSLMVYHYDGKKSLFDLSKKWQG